MILQEPNWNIRQFYLRQTVASQIEHFDPSLLGGTWWSPVELVGRRPAQTHKRAETVKTLNTVLGSVQCSFSSPEGPKWNTVDPGGTRCWWKGM